MRTLADYSREKTLARQWMLSQITSMIRNIDLKANEAAADQHGRLAQLLQAVSPQQAAILISKLAKQKNLYLAKIIDQLIHGLQGLSQALVQRPCEPSPNTTLRDSESTPKITFQNVPVQPITSPTIPLQVQAKHITKTDIKIQKETMITQHSLIANQKPLNYPPPPAKQSPALLTSSNTESKQEESSPSSTAKVSEFSAKIGQSHKLLKRLYEQGVKEDVCAESCLEMDNRIFVQASDYLAQVKTKAKGGKNSRSLFSHSPQPENDTTLKGT